MCLFAVKQIFAKNRTRKNKLFYSQVDRLRQIINIPKNALLDLKGRTKKSKDPEFWKPWLQGDNGDTEKEREREREREREKGESFREGLRHK
jgi:hypothetical protein